MKFILWPPDGKSRLIGKDPDAGKDWEQEKGATEDEMLCDHMDCTTLGFPVHHQLPEFTQTHVH